MALTTYTELKAALADWLNRTDLTSQIPDFITLAEAEMKRRLRRSTTRTTLSISANETTAPSDMAELRSAYLESASPSQDLPLRLCTPEMLAERRARSSDVAGRPTDIMYTAGKIIVEPTPDTTYTARITYFTQLTALSSSVASNTVLSEAPDAYLYGSLLQAEPFLEHDTRVPLWQAKFDNAINQLNTWRENEEYGASIKDVRLPRVFG